MKYLLFVSILMLTLSSCGNKKESGDKDYTDLIPVKEIEVVEKLVNREISAHGLLTTEEEVNLSFKTAGIIQSMFVKEGDKVEKGQILAQLDLAEINARESQIKESYNKALRDLQRAQNLHADSVITLEQLQNAQTALNIIQKSSQIIAYDKKYSEIIAPANGVIIKKIANTDEYVMPGATIYCLSAGSTDGLIIKSAITTEDWINISKKDIVKIQLEAYPDKEFRGTILQIAEHADPKSGLYTIDIRIHPDKEKLSVGMFAKIHITTNKQITYKILPLTCITEGTGKEAFIYIAKGNEVEKVPVKIAYINQGTAFISHGLEKIGKVINEGAGFLSDNTLVRIVE